MRWNPSIHHLLDRLDTREYQSLRTLHQILLLLHNPSSQKSARWRNLLSMREDVLWGTFRRKVGKQQGTAGTGRDQLCGYDISWSVLWEETTARDGGGDQGYAVLWSWRRKEEEKPSPNCRIPSCRSPSRRAYRVSRERIPRGREPSI